MLATLVVLEFFLCMLNTAAIIFLMRLYVLENAGKSCRNIEGGTTSTKFLSKLSTERAHSPRKVLRSLEKLKKKQAQSKAHAFSFTKDYKKDDSDDNNNQCNGTDQESSVQGTLCEKLQFENCSENKNPELGGHCEVVEVLIKNSDSDPGKMNSKRPIYFACVDSNLHRQPILKELAFEVQALSVLKRVGQSVLHKVSEQEMDGNDGKSGNGGGRKPAHNSGKCSNGNIEHSTEQCSGSMSGAGGDSGSGGDNGDDPGRRRNHPHLADEVEEEEDEGDDEYQEDDDHPPVEAQSAAAEQEQHVYPVRLGLQSNLFHPETSNYELVIQDLNCGGERDEAELGENQAQEDVLSPDVPVVAGLLDDVGRKPVDDSSRNFDEAEFVLPEVPGVYPTNDEQIHATRPGEQAVPSLTIVDRRRDSENANIVDQNLLWDPGVNATARRTIIQHPTHDSEEQLLDSPSDASAGFPRAYQDEGSSNLRPVISPGLLRRGEPFIDHEYENASQTHSAQNLTVPQHHVRQSELERRNPRRVVQEQHGRHEHRPDRAFFDPASGVPIRTDAEMGVLRLCHPCRDSHALAHELIECRNCGRWFCPVCYDWHDCRRRTI